MRAADANDVDGGPTRLVSPTMDLSGVADARIVFSHWFYTAGGNPDALIVVLSEDNGGSWTLARTITENSTGWQEITIRVDEVITPTAAVRARFSVADPDSDSITEAGIDAFRVTEDECLVPSSCDCAGDISGDGRVDGGDVTAFVACALGGGENCECAELDGAAGIDGADAGAFVGLLLSGFGCD